MKPILYRAQLDVRFADLDAYGHVNTTNYFDYVISSRLAFVQERFGLGLKDFVDRGLAFYITRFEINFRRPIPGVQRIAVTSHIRNIKESRGGGVFEIRSADERVLYSDGSFEFACVDLTTQRPTACPDWCRDLFLEPTRVGGAPATSTDRALSDG